MNSPQAESLMALHEEVAPRGHDYNDPDYRSRLAEPAVWRIDLPGYGDEEAWLEVECADFHDAQVRPAIRLRNFPYGIPGSEICLRYIEEKGRWEGSFQGQADRPRVIEGDDLQTLHSLLTSKLSDTPEPEMERIYDLFRGLR